LWYVCLFVIVKQLKVMFLLWYVCLFVCYCKTVKCSVFVVMCLFVCYCKIVKCSVFVVMCLFVCYCKTVKGNVFVVVCLFVCYCKTVKCSVFVVMCLFVRYCKTVRLQLLIWNCQKNLRTEAMVGYGITSWSFRSNSRLATSTSEMWCCCLCDTVLCIIMVHSGINSSYRTTDCTGFDLAWFSSIFQAPLCLRCYNIINVKKLLFYNNV